MSPPGRGEALAFITLTNSVVNSSQRSEGERKLKGPVCRREEPGLFLVSGDRVVCKTLGTDTAAARQPFGIQDKHSSICCSSPSEGDPLVLNESDNTTHQHFVVESSSGKQRDTPSCADPLHNAERNAGAKVQCSQTGGLRYCSS